MVHFLRTQNSLTICAKMKKETPPIGKQGRRNYDDEFKA